MTKQSRAKRIADLNDKFRKNLVTGGRTYMTAGFMHMKYCRKTKGLPQSGDARASNPFHLMHGH